MSSSYIPPNKPQAASHMLWFFVLPAVGFTIWASTKLVSGLYVQTKTEQSVESRLATLAKTDKPGDRWQAAYALAQELQKISKDGSLASLPSERRQNIFSELAAQLSKSNNDLRLRRYLVLTLGQLGDVFALAPLEKSLDDKDSEIRFFAAWGMIGILSKHSEVLRPHHLDIVSSWTKDPDPSLKKIAATFLVQQKLDKSRIDPVLLLLKDSDMEVRLNAAVALASTGHKEGESVLSEIFDLEKLRDLNIRSTKDLEQLIASSYGAVKKLNSPTLTAKAESLRSQVRAGTPEGDAILAGMK